MFCCLRTCLNANLRTPRSTSHRSREPEIHLDAAFMGPEVILLSNQLRITGTGGALATAPLVQSKSYFEVKIQQSGTWSVGLATRQTDLSKKIGGTDRESWCLCSDNSTRFNDEVFRPAVVTTQPQANGNACGGLIGIDEDADDVLLTVNQAIAVTSQEQEDREFPGDGDIIGVTFDHIELNFYFNGKSLEVPFRNVKGNVYPVVFVGNGAILDVILDNFTFGPPPGFDKIMIEQSLL
ncbi:SPRY domain-containing protein 7 [Episyrphus balteatus]|uniref:SPRY domain-containing protein 7 n=1 Tax=Episyrphus balteatus TaxID=286459 RepID=UPI00248544BD|nr:SPRY domain-containing protein 7 [Episyrphus balteatus]